MTQTELLSGGGKPRLADRRPGGHCFVCSVHGFYKKPLRTQHKDVALHPSQASGLVMCSALTRGQEARTPRAIFPFYESGVSRAEKCSLHTPCPALLCFPGWHLTPLAGNRHLTGKHFALSQLWRHRHC